MLPVKSNRLTTYPVRNYSQAPSPDRRLLRFSPSSITAIYAEKYPKTLVDYWQVAQTMQKKNMLPFVHGQNVCWSIPARVLERFGHEHLRSLRAPHPHFSKTSHEILSEVNAIAKKQLYNLPHWFWMYFFPQFTTGKNQLDHQMMLRRHLVSVTLGAFHWEPDETPFNYVFGGDTASKFLTHDGNRSVMEDEKARSFIKEMVLSAFKEKKAGEYFLDKAWNFYEEAHAFPIGQLIVFGIPMPLLDRAIYPCKTFGRPLRMTPQEFVRRVCDPDLSMPTNQARLILSADTLHPESGIEVVNVMDEEAVQRFTKGIELPSPWQDPHLKRMVKVEKTDVEEKTRAQFRDFYKRIDKAITETKLL